MQDSQVEVYLWTEHIHTSLWYLPSSLMVEKTKANLEIRPKLGSKHISATNGIYEISFILKWKQGHSQNRYQVYWYMTASKPTR